MEKKENDFLVALKAILIVAIVLGIIFLAIYLIARSQDPEAPGILDATTSDIAGNWTQGLFQNTYYFVPSCNINGLVLRFEIYDSDYKLLNTIDKQIGDVKKGQQYTVTLTVDEYWTGSQVRTTVLHGTKTIF